MTNSDFPSNAQDHPTFDLFEHLSPPLPRQPETIPSEDSATIPALIPKIEEPPSPRPVQRVSFSAHTSAILHFNQIGTILSLRLNEPVLLGRGQTFAPDERIDLTDFNAYQHGVSRTHCQLKRGKYSLTITDLGSANGTFLNGERLLPSTSYNIEHGDALRLGTLEIIILFSTANAN